MLQRDRTPHYFVDVDPTWEEMEQMCRNNINAVTFDYKEGDFRIITKVNMSMVAYVGIKKELMQQKFDNFPGYDEIHYLTKISPHGGFTFAGTFTNNPDDSTLDDYFYYGWDYAHLGDATLYPKFGGTALRGIHTDHDRKWMPHDVRDEAFEILDQFKSFFSK